MGQGIPRQGGLFEVLPPRGATEYTELWEDRMVAVYVSSLLLMTLLACGAVWCLLRLHYHIVDGLRAENRELRDRLYAKNALPPSGVDLTEKYEERQERTREQQQMGPIPRNKGPLAKLTAQWTEKDRTLVERGNVDATRGRLN